MAMKQLGETLDIHCGGVDNIFPHHENEIAQSEAITGKPFVRFWVHNEHLLVDGEKMAKSKGNFYTLRDLLDRGYDPLAVRYLLVSVPYRKQMNFTFDGLLQAQRSLDRIKEFTFRLNSANLAPGASAELAAAISEAATQFDAGLDDDLNTAQALAAVFELIRKSNIALTEDGVREDDRRQILSFFRKVDERLAIIPPMEELVQGDAEIEGLIAQRNQARKNRDFAMSDRIRDQLLDRGIVIEDTREGTRWRRK
jgi:cysteinyl-tRNA synthetase